MLEGTGLREEREAGRGGGRRMRRESAVRTGKGFAHMGNILLLAVRRNQFQ